MPAPSTPTEVSFDGGSSRRPRTTAIAVGAGLMAYALALVATLPARVIAPDGSDAAGTVWHGSATFGGAVARWDASLPESVASASLGARVSLDGPATVLTGTAHWRPFGGTTLTAVRGRASWAQLAAAVPALAADCAVMLDVDLARVAANDLTGTVTTLPGSCARIGASARSVPRLIATFSGATGRVTTWTDRTTPLATVALGGGSVHLHLTPVGATVLPGPGRVGDLEFAL